MARGKLQRPRRWPWPAVMRNQQMVKALLAASTVVIVVVVLMLNDSRVTTSRTARHNGRSNRGSGVNNRLPFYVKTHPFICGQIVRNNVTAIREAMTKKREMLSDYECFDTFSDCDGVRSRYYYPSEPDSDEERHFPIAYVIMIFEHLQQVEMLLNALYAPQNLYCFHVDLKSPQYVHNAVERLAGCFENVLVVSSPRAVGRGTSFVIDAMTAAIEQLYAFEQQTGRPPWRYLISLQNHDFPLKTNLEIVRILKMYNGFNDVELSASPSWRTTKFFAYQRSASGVQEMIREVPLKRGPPPFNVTFYKGSVVASLSRPFLDSVRQHPLYKSLKSYLKYTLFGDELFWSTLNHDQQFGFPGTYPGRCVNAGLNVWVSRFAVWQYGEYKMLYGCQGCWRNAVCIQSCGDLSHLIHRPELFVNKVMQSCDVIAIDCLHQLLFYRRYYGVTMGAPNISDYERTSAVSYRRWIEQGKPGESFPCVTCTRCAH